MSLKLSPNPPTVKNLLNADLFRLEAQNDDLPRDPWDCMTCGCKGKPAQGITRKFLWYGPDGVLTEYECDCLEQYQLRLFLLNAGIEQAYQEFSQRDIGPMEQAGKEALADYLKHAKGYVNRGIGLVMHGQSFTGKTLVATLILKSLLAEGYNCYFTSFTEMINNATEGWYDKERRAWYRKRIQNAKILCIDDIGQESEVRKETVLPIFNETLRARVAGRRPTIITTNLSLESLGNYYQIDRIDKRVYNFLGIIEGCSLFTRFIGQSYKDDNAERLIMEARAGICRPALLG